LSFAIGMALGVPPVGCGAHSEIPDTDPTNGATAQGVAGSRASAGTPAASPGNNQDIFGATPLPECSLGPIPQPGVACAFMADGRCYETQSEGCACICDATRSTTCVGRIATGTTVGLTCTVFP